MLKSLRTAAEILLLFTDEAKAIGVSEIARRTGLTKGQVSKILATFRHSGFLQQDPDTRQYSVGVKAFALGSRYVNYHPLAREGLPVLRRLVEQTGHSARLTVMADDVLIYLAQVEGRLLSDTGWRVGTFLPFHATSAGKVTLAFLDKARSAAIIDTLEMEAVGPETITDKSALREQIRRIASRGFGTSRSESTPGLAAVAVPVFGPSNAILSTLSLSYPQHLVTEERERELAAVLHEAARTLSQRMGAVAYPFGDDQNFR